MSYSLFILLLKIQIHSNITKFPNHNKNVYKISFNNAGINYCSTVYVMRY